MEDLRQSVLCNFIEKSCEEDHHNECVEVYEGLGIKAICICNCHKEIGVSVSGKRSNRHKIAGRQSTLEEIQAD